MKQALMKMYPHIDDLMADCLINAYENNYIDDLLERGDFKKEERIDSTIPKHVLVNDAISITSNSIDLKSDL